MLNKRFEIGLRLFGVDFYKWTCYKCHWSVAVRRQPERIEPVDSKHSFYGVLARSPQLKRLYIVWMNLPNNRRKDLIALGRALLREDGISTRG